MNHMRRTEQNFYTQFQPSAYSGGIQPYVPPMQPNYYGDMDSDDLDRQGSFTDVYTLRDRVNMLDDYSITRLSNFDSLKFRDQMGQVAANNAEAQLKTAYWLKVAWLASGGAWGKVDAFKSASDGALEQGVRDGEKAGSAGNGNMVTSYYSSAYNLLKNNASVFSDNKSVYDKLLEVLGEGTKTASVARAQELYDESEGEEQEGRDQAECEDSIMGFIPGYCENQMLFKVLGGSLVLTVGLFAARGVYKQFAALKREVEKS
jgi:hypothetical protein